MLSENLKITQLRKTILCTFVNIKNLKNTTDLLYEKIPETIGNIDIYKNLYTRDGVICIYYVDSSNKYVHDNTIKIHRKSYTNTLYTINALNAIIIRSNNNTVDHEYQIQWDIYRDRFLLNIDITDSEDIGMPLILLDNTK